MGDLSASVMHSSSLKHMAYDADLVYQRPREVAQRMEIYIVDSLGH